MTLIVIALVAFSIVLDVIGQLCFKIGLDRLPELEGGFRLNAFWGQVFNAPMLWAGIALTLSSFSSGWRRCRGRR